MKRCSTEILVYACKVIVASLRCPLFKKRVDSMASVTRADFKPGNWEVVQGGQYLVDRLTHRKFRYAFTFCIIM